jgi:hypothetical protein
MSDGITDQKTAQEDVEAQIPQTSSRQSSQAQEVTGNAFGVPKELLRNSMAPLSRQPPCLSMSVGAGCWAMAASMGGRVVSRRSFGGQYVGRLDPRDIVLGS